MTLVICDSDNPYFIEQSRFCRNHAKGFVPESIFCAEYYFALFSCLHPFQPVLQARNQGKAEPEWLPLVHRFSASAWKMQNADGWLQFWEPESASPLVGRAPGLATWRARLSCDCHSAYLQGTFRCIFGPSEHISLWQSDFYMMAESLESKLFQQTRCNDLASEVKW